MECIVHPTYFPNLGHFVAMVTANHTVFEVCDNYQKQSYRNRADICTANGTIALTVPVKYSQKHRQQYKDVKIANDEKWQLQHLKSLQSAYSMSPFYEYYIDDLMPLFETEFNFILDLNLQCFDIIHKQLQADISTSQTTSFLKEVTEKTDYRLLVNRNQSITTLKPYTQVFTDKFGFISNLSILDLLFNEGPNTTLYLKKQNLELC